MNAFVRQMQIPAPPKELVITMSLAGANMLFNAAASAADLRFGPLTACLHYAFREDNEKDGLA